MVAPDDFITVAEDTGLVLPLGAWVLEAACSQAALWLPDVPDLVMSVNVSARQLSEPGFVEMVHAVLGRTGLPASALGVEVTESVLVVASSVTAESIDALRALGVKLSIDDFGTGYASLSYLAQFRPDVIKIDKSFVQGLDEPMNAAIAAAVIGLAHSIGMKVVAEGVESYEHRAVLDGLGCDIGQGHLFAAALSVERAGQLVAGEASAGSR
jgi:EAL domain-containing protein (putative c-di-GMP-specific phosphodiesterase class I)